MLKAKIFKIIDPLCSPQKCYLVLNYLEILIIWMCCPQFVSRLKLSVTSQNLYVYWSVQLHWLSYVKMSGCINLSLF